MLRKKVSAWLRGRSNALMLSSVVLILAALVHVQWSGGFSRALPERHEVEIDYGERYQGPRNAMGSCELRNSCREKK